MNQPPSIGDVAEPAPVECAAVISKFQQHGVALEDFDQTVDHIASHIERCATCQAALDGLILERVLPSLNERLEAKARALIHGLDLNEQADVAAALLLFEDDGNTENDAVVASKSCEVVMLSEVRGAARASESVPERFTGHFLPGQVLCGSVGKYVIKGLKKSNDFSETYEATVQGYLVGSDVQEQSRVVIRIPRVAADMSHQGAADRLGLLAGLLEAEAMALRRLAGSEHAAQLIDRGEYVHRLVTDASPSVFVVYRYVEGDNLMAYMNERYGRRFTGIAQAEVFFKWARMLTAAVLDIHQRLVIHGDICPSNILVDRHNGRPVFVDFGQSLFLQAMNGIDDFRAHPYRAPDEVKTPSSDLFSLGGVLYFLATGSDPRGLGHYDDIELLKQQVEGQVRDVNPKLFEQEAGVVDVIARCLRKHSRVQHAAHLLQDIEIFKPTSAPAELVDDAIQLNRLASELDATGSALFRWVAGLRMRSLIDTLKDMSRGVLDFSGDSKDVCSAACAFLGGLGAGDEYLTISTPMFWYPGNMGINGRFLTTNRMAAVRGARIKRLFVLDDDLADEHLGQIVAAQRKVAADLGYSETYSVKYIVMTPEARRLFVREGKHFGLFIRQSECIAMFPVYNEEGTLVMLRFRTDPTLVRGLRSIFDSLMLSALPLADLQLPIRWRTAHTL
jgi:serine/threonine protein kinase